MKTLLVHKFKSVKEKIIAFKMFMVFSFIFLVSHISSQGLLRSI